MALMADWHGHSRRARHSWITCLWRECKSVFAGFNALNLHMQMKDGIYYLAGCFSVNWELTVFFFFVFFYLKTFQDLQSRPD